MSWICSRRKRAQRFAVFGEDAENAAVGTVEEWFVLVGQRGGFESVVIMREIFPVNR